jgi:hypothetical protein
LQALAVAQVSAWNITLWVSLWNMHSMWRWLASGLLQCRLVEVCRRFRGVCCCPHRRGDPKSYWNRRTLSWATRTGFIGSSRQTAFSAYLS